MKAKLAQIWNNFITSGIDESLEPRDRTRLVFLNSTLLLGLVVLLYYIPRDLSAKSDQVFSEVLIGTVFLFDLLLLRFTKKIGLVVDITLLVLLINFLYILVNPSADKAGLYWLAAFPIAAFFLKGKKGGLLWTVTFIIFSWAIIHLVRLGVFETVFSRIEITTALISLGVFTLLMYFYESISEAYIRLVDKQRDDLGVIAEELKIEVEQRKKSEQTLANSLSQIEEQNKSLTDTKRAILNLLEDEKELQEQLEKEKAGVERKVEERTAELKAESIELAQANQTIEESILKLQEEKSRLDASIHSLPIGFIMTDVNNLIFAINRKAKEIFGLDQQVLKIDEIEEKIKGVFSINEMSKKAKISKLPEELKLVEFGKSALHVFVSPIIAFAKEDYLGSVVLIEDITEQVVQNRSKDEFFSIASHELRTPLTAIRSYTALIRDDYSKKLHDKDFDQMIGNVHESSLRLIQIVNDFLDVSKLEQHKIIFRPESISIAEIVQEVYKNVGALAKEKNLKVTLKGSEKVVVFADKERVKQILFNLIGNGIKFTKKGGVKVEISKSKSSVKISVIDTGKGIPLANQKLLFKKLQQAEGSLLTRDSNQATGLGLYVSKLLVEGMKGEIRLEKTEVDKGTTFSFSLPSSKTD